MIYLGADHRGYGLKEKIKTWLKGWEYEFEDLGNDRLDSEDDYPDFAIKVAKKLGKEGNFGVLVCESGVGMDIVANRFPKVRCGLGFSQQQIRLAKRDDNINCLTLAADFVSDDDAKAIIQIFLETQFSKGEKYLRRLKKIEKIK
ncbi:MAG TPA: RpiB/LacA/LacB family sugar-phosphate isomerase [Patescibacteria group bacterium]|nr:RpiB/LacA/LacB family sugar-phosphate isomerase [Patescibacteria group bacterium]